jgi:hypothetical protein
MTDQTKPLSAKDASSIMVDDYGVASDGRRFLFAESSREYRQRQLKAIATEQHTVIPMTPQEFEELLKLRKEQPPAVEAQPISREALRGVVDELDKLLLEWRGEYLSEKDAMRHITDIRTKLEGMVKS